MSISYKTVIVYIHWFKNPNHGKFHPWLMSRLKTDVVDVKVGAAPLLLDFKASNSST